MKGSRISSPSIAAKLGHRQSRSTDCRQLDRTDTRILMYLNNVSKGHAVQANVAPIESGSSRGLAERLRRLEIGAKRSDSNGVRVLTFPAASPR
jgi:hypothetical protein